MIRRWQMTEGTQSLVRSPSIGRDEYVYRRKVRVCEFCEATACIELHVGRGGNYSVLWVCSEHDREPDHYFLSSERRT
jgi:hypothetical protein